MKCVFSIHQLKRCMYVDNSGVILLVDATRRNMESTQLTSLDFSFNLIQFKAKMHRFDPIDIHSSILTYLLSFLKSVSFIKRDKKLCTIFVYVCMCLYVCM